jgi:toxin CptA
MHNAPAVSYPVGRSRFQGRMMSVVSLLGLVSAAVWFTQAEATGWRQWLMLSGATLVAFGAWWQWRHPVIGQLAWDGVAWTWTEADTSVPVQLVLIADLQQAMLLLLDGARAANRPWVWVDRDASSMRWLALRRAVHQHPRLDADLMADGQQPGAPQS